MTKAEKERRQRLQALGDVAADMEGFGQGREVLTPVRSVQTIFPQFDVATRVNGYPIQRVCMVHGPSGLGKTVLLLGLGRSFLEREHFYFHVDAEFTTPDQWVVEMLREFADYPTFRALRPTGYEDTADTIRKACEVLVAARKAGKIPMNTTALFGLDSLQKLVPKNYMEKLAKDGGIDPQKGRGGMLQAALNSAWMKELVPLMYHANAGIVLLSRESENTDPGKSLYDPDYKVIGGKAPYYDSSLVLRVTRKEWVTKGKTKANPGGIVIGEKHMVQIMKTKVGGKDGRTTRCYFHTSNGEHIPAGFDLARDVIELGLTTGVLKKDSGNKLLDQGTGEDYGVTHAAVIQLTNDPRTLADLRNRVQVVATPDDEVE